MWQVVDKPSKYLGCNVLFFEAFFGCRSRLKGWYTHVAVAVAWLVPTYYASHDYVNVQVWLRGLFELEYNTWP